MDIRRVIGLTGTMAVIVAVLAAVWAFAIRHGVIASWMGSPVAPYTAAEGWQFVGVATAIAVVASLAALGFLSRGSGNSARKRTLADSRLEDAMRSLAEGFLLWDADDRLVAFDDRSRELYAGAEDLLVPGHRFEDNFRECVRRGVIVPPPGADVDAWIRDRVAQHRHPSGPIERHLGDGRVLQVEERQTSEGGIVGIAIDVTETRRTEAAVRESELRLKDFAESASDWFWEMGADLRFTGFSGRAEEILGLPVAHLIGKTRKEVALDSDYPAEAAKWRRHLADLNAHRPFRNFTYTLRGAEGERREVMISGTPVFGDDGAFLGYRGTGTDITAETEAEKRAAAAHRRLLDAVESVSDGFALWDEHDRLILTNSRLRAIFTGLGEAQERGLTFEQALQIGVERRVYADIGDTQAEVEAWIMETVSRHRSPGETFEVKLTGNRWLLVSERRTESGLTVGTYTDITRRKEDEESLRNLSRAVEQSPAAVLITDPEGTILYVNRRFVQNTGFEVEEAVGRKANLTKSGEMPESFYTDLWRTLMSGQEWQGEFLNRRKNGDLYWEVALISPIVGPDGKITHFVSVQEDVTDRKRAEEKLHGAADQLRDILEASPIAVGITRRTDPTLIFGNSRFAELFGVGHLDLVGGDTTEFMIKMSERIGILRALERQGHLRDVEVERRRPNGTRFWYLLSVELIEFEDEEAVLWWAYDITEQKQAREQLAQLANHDILTGLANRRLFLDRMHHALARARRGTTSGALLYFDLDGFKAVNDSHGHRFGDWLLEETAMRLRKCVRESDLVSRVGGDEFTLILEDIGTTAAAEAVAVKVVDSLSAPFEKDGEVASVGVSIGIAFFDGSETDAEELVVRADRAMYRAKRSGKGTTKLYDPAIDGARA